MAVGCGVLWEENQGTLRSQRVGELQAGEERRFSILSAVIEQVKSDDNEDGVQPSLPARLVSSCHHQFHPVKYSITARQLSLLARLNPKLPTQKVY